MRVINNFAPSKTVKGVKVKNDHVKYMIIIHFELWL